MIYKTNTSFPFEKGLSLKKKTCLSNKTGGKQRHLPPSHFLELNSYGPNEDGSQ